ncbi:MAG: hypothetical protein A2074_04555 [Candidatus Aquicultor primus]|uniref:WH2 domain-containing protein n=1 Tax=Candidatus Aquicultor primus TaxID=1797195 RepID=A0A1F2UQB1_9ACTN|nr:MAG: hypothetical protein A2074_04555 [Candidatus Aquicultor primus]HCG99893.1 hypothetical protein [Actinomycetota bacterium]
MCKDEFVELVSEHAKLGLEDAERVSKSVLLTLRSRLTAVEVLELNDSLACDLEDLWDAGWLQKFASKLQSLRELDRSEFLEQIRQAADLKTTEDATIVTQIVFRILKSSIPKQEIEAMSKALPSDLREFWQAAEAI